MSSLAQQVSSAVAALKRGDVAIFPTDTFFALGAHALNEAAVSRVFDLKGRLENRPLPVLVHSMELVELVAADIPKIALVLAKRFWPGPLTIVLPKSQRVPSVVSGGLETIGVRVPAHTIALDVLRGTGAPITGTSANPTGVPPTKDVQQVHQWFDGTGTVIVDSPCGDETAPSTVIDLTRQVPTIIREGSVPAEALRSVLGDVTFEPSR